jgi:hypothetical protein
MTSRLFILLTAAIPAAGLLAAPASAAAAPRKHALLIGIGDYTYDVPDLEGPPHDVATLKRTLIDRWQFPADNVKVLSDGEATKARILGAFDELATSTKAGDYIFIYYSGHGTSSYERSDLGLDNNTGAVVPADFKLSTPKASDGLIVGNRDLRPRLERIDRDREVMVVFDSCYSGAAVRSLRARGKPRFVELPRPKTRALSGFPNDDEGEFGSATEKAVPFPYQNLIYISAASKSEAARDITSAEITRGELNTVDGRPHGALTNSLLEALGGAADSNGDRTLSYAELYGYVRENVSETFPHQPQLLAPDTRRDAVLAKSVMAAGAPAAATKPGKRPAEGDLRVKVDGAPEAVAKKVKGLKGVAVVDGGAYDVLIAPGKEGLTIFHASGDVIAALGSSATPDAVAARLQKQLAVRALVDLKFDDQDFNVTVRVPGNRGFLRKGDPFTIEAEAEREAVFLLIDVDTSGHVSVLLPYNEAEMAPQHKLRVPPEPDALRVSPPYGTEYLKVFAFRQKPAGLDKWMKESFDATDPKLGKLVEWLRGIKGGRASDRLKVVTLESGS